MVNKTRQRAIVAAEHLVTRDVFIPTPTKPTTTARNNRMRPLPSVPPNPCPDVTCTRNSSAVQFAPASWQMHGSASLEQTDGWR